MNTLAKLLFVAMLLVPTGCYMQQNQFAAKDTRPDEMTSSIDTVTIAGAPEAVFDLITSARFWPQWHPATKAVGGVTERPYRLGDRIYEAGRIGAQDFKTSWEVVEHARPSRVVLQSEKSSTRITYTFQSRDGHTVFSRKLEYNRKNFAAATNAPGGAEEFMRAQSEQAVNQLKAMVEKILREEAAGIR